MYTRWVEKNMPASLSLVYRLSSVDWFSTFFRCDTLHEICSEANTKYPISPETRRYVTLWNVNVRKLVSVIISEIYHIISLHRNLDLTNILVNAARNIINIILE